MVHRVLAIPELLALIFSHLDRQSNAINACISKQWSNIALDTIWADVDDLHRLFSLLVPLTKVRGVYEATKPPQSADWQRFDKYARRVRKLHYNVTAPRHKCLNNSIFDHIARTRLSLIILPNLHTIEWITHSMGDLAFSVLFMHDRVQRFAVWLPLTFPSIAKSELQAHFQDIIARMPSLTFLDLRMTIAMHNVEENICELLRNLPKLQKLVLPIFHQTSRIMTEVSRLADLGVFQFEYSNDQGSGDIDDILAFSPTLSEGAFPSLWDLSLVASLADIARFIKMPFAPTNLTVLYIDCPLVQSAADLQDFLQTVSENCQLLEGLHLELLWIVLAEADNQDGNHALYPKRDDRITFDVIRPVLACSNLTVFSLTHDYPVEISHDNITELATNWPFLESFILACEPVNIPSEPSLHTLTLLSLLPFARYCPNIHTLGLFINATTADLATPTDTHIHAVDPPRFKKLSKLSMGVSRITDPGAVALFLSQFCPLECEIEYGVTWECDLGDGGQVAVGFVNGAWNVNPGMGGGEGEGSTNRVERLMTEVARRCERWKEVGRMLPLLTRLRMQERARTQALMNEVEDLRVRNQILMEKARMSANAGGRGCGTCVVV